MAVIPPGRHVHVEVMPTLAGTDLAAAEAQLSTLIVGQIVKFVTTKHSDMQVAGVPAVRFDGEGLEADDGDDSIAQATVFTYQEKAWILLGHAEGNGVAGDQQGIDAVLAAIQGG